MKEIDVYEGEILIVTLLEDGFLRGHPKANPRTGYFLVVCSELKEFEIKDLEDEARELGKDHGISAASWVFDGNTAEETYQHVLKGIEAGDPEIMDQLPSADLSGQWADGMTEQRIMTELGLPESYAETQEGSELAGHLCDLYCDAFNEQAQQEVERLARNHLEYQEAHS